MHYYASQRWPQFTLPARKIPYSKVPRRRRKKFVFVAHAAPSFDMCNDVL